MQIPLDVSFPTANYIDPVTRGPALLIVNVLLWPIVAAIVALRLYTRIIITKGFGADDILIIIAMIVTTGFAGVSIYATQVSGFDRHMWDVDPRFTIFNLKLGLASQIIFGIAATCYRVSMLVLLLRIMTTVFSRLRYIITAMIVVSSIFGILYTTLELFQCQPISAYWTLTFMPQKCFDWEMLLLVAGIINVILDVITVLLAVPLVLQITVNRRQQVAIALLFGAGGIVCIAGIVRTYVQNQMTSSYDVTWFAYPTFIASVVELYIGILGASVPATKPFFVRYLPQLLSAIKPSSSANRAYHTDNSQNDSALAWSWDMVRHADTDKKTPLQLSSLGVIPDFPATPLNGNFDSTMHLNTADLGMKGLQPFPTSEVSGAKQVWITQGTGQRQYVEIVGRPMSTSQGGQGRSQSRHGDSRDMEKRNGSQEELILS